MKNREFRELQVSSTQLAIIFFGILIIGVVIFLLGVSVGKKHAQAALKTTTVLAQKAPEQVRDRLILPESKPGAAPATVEPAPLSSAEKAPAAKPGAADSPQTAPAPTASESAKTAPEKAPAAAPGTLQSAADKPAAQAAKTAAPPAKPEASAETTKPAPKPELPAAKVETTAPAKKGLWYVQVGALATRPEATAAAQKYRAQGYTVVVLDPQASDKKIVYRVRVGGFATKEDAEALRVKLTAGSARRLDYFLVRD